jgi:hypothetical protein
VNLTFPQLLAGAVGALLIYCAITNKTPVAALKGAWSDPATTRVVNPNMFNQAATGQKPVG